MTEELEAAQQWNGHGVLELMRKHARYIFVGLGTQLLKCCTCSIGGEWLVCDIKRQVSVFQEDTSAQVSYRSKKTAYNE